MRLPPTRPTTLLGTSDSNVTGCRTGGVHLSGLLRSVCLSWKVSCCLLPRTLLGLCPVPPSLLPLPTPGMGPCCTAPRPAERTKRRVGLESSLSPRLSWQAGGPGPGPSEPGSPSCQAALRERRGSGPEGRQAQGAALLTAQRLHWNSGHTGSAITHSARRRF